MRVSAIRFGTDLWQILESEAARVGVSVSQYVREAALMRAAAAATARGEDLFQVLAEAGANAAPGRLRARERPLHTASTEVGATRALRATSHDWMDRSQVAIDAAHAAFEDALAVTAETRQTRRHSRKTRAGGQ